MSEHKATVVWTPMDAPFTYDTYARDHLLRLGSGQALEASAAVEYKGTASRANPEELLVAALASCHMLTFLAVAARKRLTVLRYEDEAVGTLGKNDDGRIALTKVTLRPRVTFAEGAAPEPEALEKMHALAHANCFIANTCRCDVEVAPLVESRP